MVLHIRFSRIILFAAAFCSAFPLYSQTLPAQQHARSYTRQSINFTIGIASPQGREGVREFWLNGPTGSVAFLVHTDQNLALGLGADLSLLYFNLAAFMQRWPGVPLQEKPNLFVGNVFLEGTYAFLPGFQTRPFVSAQIGAEFITQALYRRVVDGVRVTHYNVGGKTRMALGMETGTTIQIAYNLGIRIALKGTLIHNDPNLSFLAQARTGIQYKF